MLITQTKVAILFCMLNAAFGACPNLPGWITINQSCYLMGQDIMGFFEASVVTVFLLIYYYLNFEILD